MAVDSARDAVKWQAPEPPTSSIEKAARPVALAPTIERTPVEFGCPGQMELIVTLAWLPLEIWLQIPALFVRTILNWRYPATEPT